MTTQKSVNKKVTAIKKQNLEKVNKEAAKQKVVMRRELKYIYPKGLIEPLARKNFRGTVRDNLRKMESQILKLRGEEKRAKKEEYQAYREKVLTTP